MAQDDAQRKAAAASMRAEAEGRQAAADAVQRRLLSTWQACKGTWHYQTAGMPRGWSCVLWLTQSAPDVERDICVLSRMQNAMCWLLPLVVLVALFPVA